MQATFMVTLYLHSYIEADHTATIVLQSGYELKAVLLLTVGAAPMNSTVLLPQAFICMFTLLYFPGAPMYATFCSYFHKILSRVEGNSFSLVNCICSNCSSQASLLNCLLQVQ